MKDFIKSISSILYERVTSPLYGAFIISWCVWNWEFLYVTFFMDEKYLVKPKIDFMLTYNKGLFFLVLWPVLSTVAIILLLPFLANAAYYISLKFNQWKIRQKNVIENNQTLTIEQSIQLREEILNQSEKIQKMIKEKDDEINRLKQVIQEYKTNNKDPVFEPDKQRVKLKEQIKEFDSIIKNPKFSKYAPYILGDASRGEEQNENYIGNREFKITLEYLISAGFIVNDGKYKMLYKLTTKGLDLHKYYIESLK